MKLLWDETLKVNTVHVTDLARFVFIMLDTFHMCWVTYVKTEH